MTNPLNWHPAQRWVPSAPTRASRLPAKRSRFSSRGALRNLQNNRCSVFESTLESRASYCFFADPDVIDVWDQPPPVSYLDLSGKRRWHTFDFLVTLKNSTRIAVAVKPHARAPRILQILGLLAGQLPPTFADRVTLVTEWDLHSDRVYNAELIHSARRTPDHEADRIVRELISPLQGGVTIADLVHASGLEGAGFRALVRLIADGTLVAIDDGRITYATRVISQHNS